MDRREFFGAVVASVVAGRLVSEEVPEVEIDPADYLPKPVSGRALLALREQWNAAPREIVVTHGEIRRLFGNISDDPDFWLPLGRPYQWRPVKNGDGFRFDWSFE